MKSACRHLIAALALLCGLNAFAAPYPNESQLRTAIGTGAGLLKSVGLELTMLDAQREGVALPLLAAGLNLETGVCVVFYNTQPADKLAHFFAAMDTADLPVWLDAIAVHEATHCVEQREAYLRRRFDKVLPPAFPREGMTVQGYVSVVRSGAVETWGEALADIASVLYLQQATPARWTFFAEGIAQLRRDLAGKSPEHDTSAWLERLIAAQAGPAPGQNIFEAAFQLRRELAPCKGEREGCPGAAGTADPAPEPQDRRVRR